MTRYRVFLGLGSNIGGREKYLSDAAAKLKQLSNTRIIWASSVYETEPFGNTEQPHFLNAVLELETGLKPPALIHETQRIEREAGRIQRERWGQREIDIDILLYDGLVFKDEAVEVPHPGLGQRRFVLVPFREIAPDVVHPISGMTIGELADAVRDRGTIKKTMHRIRI